MKKELTDVKKNTAGILAGMKAAEQQAIIKERKAEMKQTCKLCWKGCDERLLSE